MLLAIERYLAVVHPLKYSIHFTLWKAIGCAVACWAWGFTYNLAYLAPTSWPDSRGRCVSMSLCSDIGRRLMRSIGVLTILVEYVIPISCMLACYGRMACVLKHRSNSGITSRMTSEMTSADGDKIISSDSEVTGCNNRDGVDVGYGDVRNDVGRL